MSARLRVLVVVLLAWGSAESAILGQQPPVSPRASVGGAIEGSIVDDALNPVMGVTVTLTRSGNLIASHQTDASGWFRFDGLSPDTYQIAATLAGHASISKRATLRSATSSMRMGLEMARDQVGPVGAASVATGAQAQTSGTFTRTSQRPTDAVAGSGSISGVVSDANGAVLPGVTVTVSGPSQQQPLVGVTQASGAYLFPVVAIGTVTVTFELTGFKKTVRPGIVITQSFNAIIDQKMEIGAVTREVTVAAAAPVVDTKKVTTGGTFTKDVLENIPTARSPWQLAGASASGQQVGVSSRGTSASDRAYWNYDSFESLGSFKLTTDDPVSTFGADVDTASYTNTRRFLNAGQLPPPGVVRVEEFINYFRFNYAAPKAGSPVGITSEIGACPWAADHRLVLIGARAQAVEPDGPRNLVFLIDVSGSMAPAPRLPLIRTALKMFVNTLRPDDQISIVTYAGVSGVALMPTSAQYRDRINDAIDRLGAGGSTNGGAGLMLAYRLAREEFVPGGVNRIILATDGDFNVGIVGPLDLQHLIERERESGVFLSVLGVGDDNYKDATMEMLADKGNGHYSYLDSLDEARRVLIREGASTLETVAKDVKFQVEFNPTAVQAWRLIGYEDRQLAREDFNNDRKDAGELGAGHTVTVLYEVVPAGTLLPAALKAPADRPPVDPLIYQQTALVATSAARRDDWLTVKVRYKLPEGSESRLMSEAVTSRARGEHLPFASSVAEFAILLREGHAPEARWDALVARLQDLRSSDPEGERQGFVHVVELAAGLQKLRR
jgi:Ca-activated chloride channel family protein